MAIRPLARFALEAVMEQMREERKGVSAETCVLELPSPVKFEPQRRASLRADALARIAEGKLAGTTGCSAGDRFVINLHTDLDTLRADGTGAESELEGAENVSAETFLSSWPTTSATASTSRPKHRFPVGWVNPLTWGS